jgi:hypothetical protein
LLNHRELKGEGYRIALGVRKFFPGQSHQLGESSHPKAACHFEQDKEQRIKAMIVLALCSAALQMKLINC